MRILYITTFFDIVGSSAAVRNYALVNGLLENGHFVDVLTIKHPQTKVSKWFSSCPCNNIFRTRLSVSEFVVKTAKQQAVINNSFLRSMKKVVRNLIFFPDIYYNWYRFIDKSQYVDYDIVISSSDSKSSHFVAEQIKQCNPQMMWIQIWGDPWSIDSTLDRISRFRAKQRERQLLKRADKIIYISELTSQAMKKKYPEIAAKIKYVPRGYCCEVYKVKSECHSKEYNIMYPGALNAERSCIQFLDAVEKYNQENAIKFYVHFYGDYLNVISEKLKIYTCVVMHGQVGFEYIMELFKSMDAVLFISNRTGSTQIPGKLFDYMGTELPVICILSSQNINLESFLRQFEKCLFFKGDFSAIAERILNDSFGIEPQFKAAVIANEIMQ